MVIPSKHFKHLAISGKARKAKRQPKPLTIAQRVAIIEWDQVMRLANRGYSCFVPQRLNPGTNQRENHYARSRRVKGERDLGRMLAAKLKPVMPCTITLTRYSPSALDSDSVPNCFKGIRDGVADGMGVNDSPKTPVTWLYDQKPAPPRCHGFVVQWHPTFSPPVPAGDGGRGR